MEEGKKKKRCGKCRKSTNCKCGRPTVIDENAIRILEGAFADGASDEMACFLANVSTTAFYQYQKKNPKFKERKAFLKEQVKYQAKKNIRDAIAAGDIHQSNWYLERKASDEFSTKQIHEQTGEVTIKHKEEAAKRTASFRDRVRRVVGGTK